MSTTNTSADQPANPNRRKRRIRRIMAGAIVVLFVGMFTVVNLDAFGHRWVSCQVTDANGQQGGQNAVSAWEVVLDTEDCGRLVYLEGVNRDNVDEKAAQFEPGPYELKMGFTSRWAADGLLPGISPSFDEYRQVN